MEKISAFLVKRKYLILVVMLALTIVCAFLMQKVNINTDMTKYLPDDTEMSQGLDIMKEEFDMDMSSSSIITIMSTNISDEDKANLLAELKNLPGVLSLGYEEDSEFYNKGEYSRYTLTASFGFNTSKMDKLLSKLDDLCDKYDLVYMTNENLTGLPLWIAIAAVVILMVILFIMCNSWFEPILFLATIGIAVVINMGTNVFLPSVSQTTHSIAAILQLVLSMDYSIILINRYRQELASGHEKELAMRFAIRNSITAVSSSSLTTFAGLLALCFMSFKIGADMGIVLAKGVLISLICIITVLPALILIFGKIIDKTTKKVIKINMKPISRFSYSCRKIVALAFAVMFVSLVILKGNTKITYSMPIENEITDQFTPFNQMVLLYSNEDEETIAKYTETISEATEVESISAYSTTLGKKYTVDEMVYVVSQMTDAIDATQIQMLYQYYFMTHPGDTEQTLSIDQLFTYLVEMAEDPQMSAYIDSTIASQLKLYKGAFDENKKQLVGENYSIMMINTVFVNESKEAYAFLDKTREDLNKMCKGNFYFIGNTPMEQQMSKTFGKEYNKISIITALMVFAVVLIAFKSIIIPAILVLTVQSAVYALMCFMTIQGSGMYYLALLIVQSILLGAAIDYAILYTNYYRECRKKENIKDALLSAYNGSIHTILTSGLIMVIVTYVLGYAFGDDSVKQICHLLSKGSACAIILIVFLLPGVLATLDRFTAGKLRLR